MGLRACLVAFVTCSSFHLRNLPSRYPRPSVVIRGTGERGNAIPSCMNCLVYFTPAELALTGMNSGGKWTRTSPIRMAKPRKLGKRVIVPHSSTAQSHSSTRGAREHCTPAKLFLPISLHTSRARSSLYCINPHARSCRTCT